MKKGIGILKGRYHDLKFWALYNKFNNENIKSDILILGNKKYDKEKNIDFIVYNKMHSGSLNDCASIYFFTRSFENLLKNQRNYNIFKKMYYNKSQYPTICYFSLLFPKMKLIKNKEIRAQNYLKLKIGYPEDLYEYPLMFISSNHILLGLHTF